MEHNEVSRHVGRAAPPSSSAPKLRLAETETNFEEVRGALRAAQAWRACYLHRAATGGGHHQVQKQDAEDADTAPTVMVQPCRVARC